MLGESLPPLLGSEAAVVGLLLRFVVVSASAFASFCALLFGDETFSSPLMLCASAASSIRSLLSVFMEERGGK